MVDYTYKYLAKQEKSCDAKLEDLRKYFYGSQLQLKYEILIISILLNVTRGGVFCFTTGWWIDADVVFR